MTTEVRFHRAATVLLTAALLATLTVALTGGDRAAAIEGPVEVVYVATGQNFPDALAGANLAATVGAPMLTVNRDLPIPDATITALQALDPNRVIILGGPVAVSEAVEDALADHARSGAVTRIEGGDRHDTAARIADALPGKVHDSERVDGLVPGEIAAVLGERDTEAGWTDASGITSATSFDFTAQTDGFAFVSATVEVANRLPFETTIYGLLQMDWDGEETGASLDAAAIGGHDVRVADVDDFDDSRATIVITSAVPVAAGHHTIDLVVSSSDFRHRLANVSVVLSASGAASARGTDGIS